MLFRNTTTGAEQTAEPGTKRFAIFERNARWVAVDSHGTEVESPLELLTVAELKSLAKESGIEIPADVRKSRLVEIVRDANIQPPEEPEA